MLECEPSYVNHSPLWHVRQARSANRQKLNVLNSELKHRRGFIDLAAMQTEPNYGRCLLKQLRPICEKRIGQAMNLPVAAFT